MLTLAVYYTTRRCSFEKNNIIGRFVFGHVVIRFYFYPMRKYQPFIRTMRTDSRVHFCFFF